MKRLLWISLVCLLSIPVFFVIVFLLIIVFSYPYIVDEFETALSQIQENTLIYDRHGQPYTIVDGVEDRQIIPREQAGRYLQLSILAIEDARFLQHRGVDLFRVFGALWVNLKGGAYLQGGSTITQQLIKLHLLSPRKTLKRKVKEMFMALAVEFKFDKWTIFEHYLNTIYLGYGNYGVQQAAFSYFDRPSAKLTLAQAAFIAGLIKKPEGYLRWPRNLDRSQHTHFPKSVLIQATRRQRLVLAQLYRYRWINQEEYQQALQEPLRVRLPSRLVSKAPYFVEHVRRLLKKRHQLPFISNGGYRIYTTLDPKLQTLAESVVDQAFQQKSPPFEQGALVSMEPHNGYIRALVGGRNFAESEFNRATQAKRQPGSAYKTFVYATALESGYAPNHRMTDEPVSFEWIDSDGFSAYYEPRNFDRLYGAEREQTNARREVYFEDYVTFHKAFEQSLNTIAVQLLYDVGITKVLKKTKALKLYPREDVGLCLALGCSEVKLIDLVSAYSPFMNEGKRSNPVFILKIEDREGNELYRYQPPKKQKTIWNAWTVHQMNQLLRGVVLRGTGRAANWRGNKHHIGGKTGTTTDSRDAWFIGYSPELVTGLWFGNDDNTSMRGETGGRTPARMWSQFMRKALTVIPDRPRPATPTYRAFPTCHISGGLATYSCPDVSYYHYPAHNLPYHTCPLHPGAPLPENKGIATFTEDLESSFSDTFEPLDSPFPETDDLDSPFSETDDLDSPFSETDDLDSPFSETDDLEL